MYDFYLDSIMLPVAPAELELSINNQNRTLTLINEGEINLLRQAGLSDMEFSCLIPQQKYPFAVYKDGYQPASYYLAVLERLKTSRESFQFIVSRVRPNGELLHSTNMTVSLEDYIVTEDWKTQGHDIEVQIRLKQYRHYSTKSVEIVDPPANSPPDTPPQAIIYENRPVENPPQASTHTVVSGDTLWGLARYYLGDGSRWREIFQLNQDMLDSRNAGTGLPKYTIFSGQALALPEP